MVFLEPIRERFSLGLFGDLIIRSKTPPIEPYYSFNPVIFLAGIPLVYLLVVGAAYSLEAGSAFVVGFMRLCLRYNFIACLIPIILFMRAMLSPRIRNRMSWKDLKEDWLKLQNTAWFFADDLSDRLEVPGGCLRYSASPCEPVPSAPSVPFRR